MTTTGLILVRHGESAGNVAREAAEAAQADAIAIDQRDPDVPLSEQGITQAKALGQWLAELPTDQSVRAAWSSPYVRAVQTATIALQTAGLDLAVHLDERLRDRELGVLDRLTSRGVASRLPDEAQRRRHLGKLYYRPPGGESWADVVLRLRSFLADFERRGTDGTVLIATHDAVILLLRYVLEGLTEDQLLDIAAQQSVGNASVTRLTRAPDGGGRWQLAQLSANDYLERFGSTAMQHGAQRDVHPR